MVIATLSHMGRRCLKFGCHTNNGAANNKVRHAACFDSYIDQFKGSYHVRRMRPLAKTTALPGKRTGAPPPEFRPANL